MFFTFRVLVKNTVWSLSSANSYLLLEASRAAPFYTEHKNSPNVFGPSVKTHHPSHPLQNANFVLKKKKSVHCRPEKIVYTYLCFNIHKFVNMIPTHHTNSIFSLSSMPFCFSHFFQLCSLPFDCTWCSFR